MKQLTFILLLLSVSLSAQIWLKQDIRQIPNDINEFTVSSGTWSNGTDGSRNYIQCDASGLIYIDSKQAYGTWFFDVYSVGTTEVFFTADVAGAIQTFNGYGLRYISSGRIGFYKSTIGGFNILMVSQFNEYTASTWQKYKVTRSATGEFKIYRNSGAGFVLVDANTGTNPATNNDVTTSKYLVLDFDTGDRISNIRFKE